MRFKLVLAGTALTLMSSLFALPQPADAQGFYVNPYESAPYSGTPYSGYGFSGVPYSSYDYDRHRHVGPHNKLHWTRQEGIHWGGHYGRHHIGRHDLRYPAWY